MVSEPLRVARHTSQPFFIADTKVLHRAADAGCDEGRAGASLFKVALAARVGARVLIYGWPKQDIDRRRQGQHSNQTHAQQFELFTYSARVVEHPSPMKAMASASSQPSATSRERPCNRRSSRRRPGAEARQA